MIVRMQDPRNLETPITELSRIRTPVERFFVRSHFAVPEVDAKTFKLTVEGHVQNKLELTLDDLRAMKRETKTRFILLECAGNGRVFLAPQVRGLQWGHGAVSQAEWTGVPLGVILERAKMKAGAGDVVLIGADKGAIAEPQSPGAINFDRGIPLAKAMKDETLLVWDMNEEPLTPAHGAPLRAIVGGWYGMASVKWLTRIVVLDKPHTGFWQTLDYSVWDRPNEGLPQLVPVTAVQPKAVICRPTLHEVLPTNSMCEASGVAWAGENRVTRVEFSSDGGKTWVVENTGSMPFRWTHWNLKWSTKGLKGPVKLLARCTDNKGNTQPDKRDPDRRTYMINHLVPVEVTVK
jgi:DMSO/TMAO reductase YedYZ molybdopterin-dependent catalytic subunit